MFSEKKLIIKPLSMGQLAVAYEMDRRTIYNWLEKHADAIGEKIGFFYTPLQVKKIFEILGPPDKYIRKKTKPKL